MTNQHHTPLAEITCPARQGSTKAPEKRVKSRGEIQQDAITALIFVTTISGIITTALATADPMAIGTVGFFALITAPTAIAVVHI